MLSLRQAELLKLNLSQEICCLSLAKPSCGLTQPCKGILDQLSCSVRAEVLQVLKHPDQKKPEHQKSYEDPDSTNFLINELIKEYLNYNGYEHTANVLSVESGQPQRQAERNDLEAVLRVHTGPNAKQVPLLYSIVSSLRKK